LAKGGIGRTYNVVPGRRPAALPAAFWSHRCGRSAHKPRCLLRQRWIFASASISKPLLPLGRIVGPFFHFDAPTRWLCGQEELRSLSGGQAPWDRCLGASDKFLGVGKNLP